MSELNVASLFDLEKVLLGRSNKLFYSKSEADTVIAELKDRLLHKTEFAIQCQMAAHTLQQKLRHHKYKRCLAMAERCKDKIENPVEYDEHDDWLIINEYWERWHERWLKIAEQFKEGTY